MAHATNQSYWPGYESHAGKWVNQEVGQSSTSVSEIILDGGGSLAPHHSQFHHRAQAPYWDGHSQARSGDVPHAADQLAGLETELHQLRQQLAKAQAVSANMGFLAGQRGDSSTMGTSVIGAPFDQDKLAKRTKEDLQRNLITREPSSTSWLAEAIKQPTEFGNEQSVPQHKQHAGNLHRSGDVDTRYLDPTTRGTDIQSEEIVVLEERVAPKLEISCEVSSTEADVKWITSTTLNDQFCYRVSIVGPKNVQLDFPAFKTSCKMKLEAGNWYEVKIAAVSKGSNAPLIDNTVKFKSVLSRSEMFELYHRAEKYVGEEMAEIDVFYRNKPPVYWQKVYAEDKGVMRKYMKDANGQPGCPINNEVKGLFFSGRLFRGGLPPHSIYGSHRFIIKADRIFHEETRLYFTDFYCTYSMHYVTVVITLKGSPADAFCEANLIELNKFDNMFLKMSHDPAVEPDKGTPHFLITNSIWLELYYTEDIDTRCGLFAKEVRATGKGSSTPGGLPNNKHCPICNLYPEPPPPGYRPPAATVGEGKRQRRREAVEGSTPQSSSRRRSPVDRAGGSVRDRSRERRKDRSRSPEPRGSTSRKRPRGRSPSERERAVTTSKRPSRGSPLSPTSSRRDGSRRSDDDRRSRADDYNKTQRTRDPAPITADEIGEAERWQAQMDEYLSGVVQVSPPPTTHSSARRSGHGEEDFETLREFRRSFGATVANMDARPASDFFSSIGDAATAHAAERAAIAPDTTTWRNQRGERSDRQDRSFGGRQSTTTINRQNEPLIRDLVGIRNPSTMHRRQTEQLIRDPLSAGARHSSTSQTNLQTEQLIRDPLGDRARQPTAEIRRGNESSFRDLAGIRNPSSMNIRRQTEQLIRDPLGSRARQSAVSEMNLQTEQVIRDPLFRIPDQPAALYNRNHNDRNERHLSRSESSSAIPNRENGTHRDSNPRSERRSYGGAALRSPASTSSITSRLNSSAGDHGYERRRPSDTDPRHNSSSNSSRFWDSDDRRSESSNDRFNNNQTNDRSWHGTAPRDWPTPQNNSFHSPVGRDERYNTGSNATSGAESGYNYSTPSGRQQQNSPREYSTNGGGHNDVSSTPTIPRRTWDSKPTIEVVDLDEETFDAARGADSVVQQQGGYIDPFAVP